MARKIVSCPQCGYAKEIDEDSLPPLGTRGTCPRCKGVFSLSELLSSPPEQGRLFAQSPSDAADPAAAPAAPQLRTLTFTFTGSGKEYFGIWIVNTLLRIVTLGIYSPWAKVRKRRYFYGNTLLNDAPFDYLADPLAILKGWIVAACFIGLYSFATKVSPVVASIMMLAFFGISPGSSSGPVSSTSAIPPTATSASTLRKTTGRHTGSSSGGSSSCRSPLASLPPM